MQAHPASRTGIDEASPDLRTPWLTDQGGVRIVAVASGGDFALGVAKLLIVVCPKHSWCEQVSLEMEDCKRIGACGRRGLQEWRWGGHFLDGCSGFSLVLSQCSSDTALANRGVPLSPDSTTLSQRQRLNLLLLLLLPTGIPQVETTEALSYPSHRGRSFCETSSGTA